MMLIDSHLHSELSGDSSLTLEDVIRNTDQLGLSGVCTADHYDPIPSDVRFAHYSYGDATTLVNRLRAQYPDVHIGLGVEVTYREEAEDQIRRFLRHHPVDMAMGSVHDIGELYLREWLARTETPGLSMRTHLFPYIALLRSMARSALFDVLGHIDYVKRYNSELRAGIMLKLFETELTETLEHQIAHGGIIEVNISGLRHPCREPYPSQTILNLYHELGGRAVTVGSDAHAPAHLAIPLSLAVEHARKSKLDIVDWRSFRDSQRMPNRSNRT